MMKIKTFSIFVLLALVSFNPLFAQEEPPAPPEVERLYQAEAFFGMGKEREAKILKNLSAALRDHLKVIKEYDKGKYYRFLSESQYRPYAFPSLTKRDDAEKKREQEVFQLEIISTSLAVKYQTAKGNKSDIRKELKNTLEKLFELKEKSRAREVAELEKELKELQNELTVRKSHKKEIINRRLQELLNEDDYLDWR